MSNQVFKYDYSFMSAEKVGKFGYKKTELAQLNKKLPIFYKRIKKKLLEPELSFLQLPYDQAIVKEIADLAAKLKRRFSNLVIVGIGGSDLGARAIYQALAGDFGCYLPNKKALSLYFLGDTSDPRPISDLLKVIDLKQTVFYIVSKSGSTIEPMSNFLLLREKVIKKVGYKKHQEHFIVTTNIHQGALLKIAEKEKYLILPHAICGGRYSVLSVNGLLPAACAGLDIKKLLAGAAQSAKIFQSNDAKKNLAWIFASLQYLAYTKRRQNISVIMPYSHSLRDFGFWAKQLLAESLGKDGKGFTPIASLGPTDQHSQLQLYIDGPFDKLITFIKIAKQDSLAVPKYNDPEIAYLGSHKFSEILNIEHQATSISLMKNKRPNATIILPELNEYYLGQLFFFFEMATLYLGELLKVNVFDQPGVEESKRYIYGLLGKRGYENEKKGDN